MDDHLQAAARAVGAESTYGPVPSAIHFGRPGVTEPDPFFDGEGPVRPWRRALRSEVARGSRSPSYLPVANEVTRAFAESSGGRPMNLLAESVGGLSVTAHVLGGAVMGRDASEGVVDLRHEVFGHPGLFVADASVIPANLGVNPSLTITALAERFAAAFPPPLEEDQ